MREAVEELRSRLRQFQNTVATIEASRTFRLSGDAAAKDGVTDAPPLDPAT